MVFNSGEFLIFFPIVLILYFWVVPKKYNWAMLLAASYYFYLSWNWKLIYLIVFTTLVSYFSAIVINRTEKAKVKKLFLVLTLVVCLGILFFYKYFNFLSTSVTSVVNLFGGHADPFTLNLILPVGISFYTFQTLSYVIDVYKGKVTPERHLGYYALYVSFFPQLVAGPIERPENLLPQLHEQHPLTAANAAGGLRKMMVGFCKKLVVADLLATYVVPVYNNVEDANGFTVLVATCLFAVQIYCDFSGYTDIAIGCSEIMGIRLMQNFNRPYSAKTIKEFWSRWHISLSTWFRDYIYIPLGGNRVSTFRNCVNVMVVFLVSGLWHGAAWTFVIWGALHGAYQIIGKFTYKPRNKLLSKIGLNPDGKLVGAVRTFNTFLLAGFAWIFFRANNFADLRVLIVKLFTDWRFSLSFFSDSLSAMGLSLVGILTCIISIIILSLLDRDGLKPTPLRSRPDFRYTYVVWAIAIAWMILLAGDGASSFIYFQF
ncbi:MAG: MBOAT family protein [Clostridia bacterium]|nr:MBOAT family protein [Clostridia bacterium]